LLNSILRSIQYSREQVFIANVLKCRPTDNRDPLPDEVKTCTPFLNQQIHLLQPQLIVALGRIAAHYLLKTKATLESMRGQFHHYGEQKIPLIVTYHPAYLLRNPIDKKKAYEDWRTIQRTLQNPKNEIT
jgi:DNA polymerase